MTVRNDGDVPLKDVFLKFPQADYWIDDTDRLTYVPERIEIGDMDQKSEKRYVFWGEASGFLTERKPLLGHSNGIGSIDGGARSSAWFSSAPGAR